VSCAVAGALLIVAGRTSNHLVEITLTTLAAYGSFLLAEQIGGSGVLASLAAGLVIGAGGGRRLGSITIAGQEAVKAFWEYAAFLTNSLIFILIGVREAHQNFSAVIWPAVAAIILVLLARAATVYPTCRLFAGTSHAVPVAHQHVLFWGGLRGALALALALGLPMAVAEREVILRVTFAVVAFSVFVQTLTMTPLLKRLHVIS
jgi:CPA1 family monovalent cation:H+ antiporter